MGRSRKIRGHNNTNTVDGFDRSVGSVLSQQGMIRMSRPLSSRYFAASLMSHVTTHLSILYVGIDSITENANRASVHLPGQGSLITQCLKTRM